MDQLPWLPTHCDFPAALTAAKSVEDPAQRLNAFAALAGYRRDLVMTGRIDRLASPLLRDDAVTEHFVSLGLTPLRLAMVASHTVDHLVPAIRVAGLARRVALSEVYVAPYGLYRQALLGDEPELLSFAPQLFLLALDAHDAPLDVCLDAKEADVEAAISDRVNELRALWRSARRRFNARVIQQTFVSAEPPLFGESEALVPGSPGAVIQRLNTAIRKVAREDGILLLDIDQHVSWYGREGWSDPVRWHQGKQLVSPAVAPRYGDLVARVAAASVGLSRKCLVLDLDNTLWGGVVGDDGVDNLRLGPGCAAGEAFSAFQRYVSRLGQRGIILAVCSKNERAAAEAGFGHPAMSLKRTDIACFVANWEDKASNLRRIARALNIGLDALVFVDDNPAERDIVRRELPEVAVPELPADEALWPFALAAAGYFETTAFTSDDAARARTYAANAERTAALDSATDMAGYLKGLRMALTGGRVTDAQLPRVVQLINKTNQFNLTTRRRDDATVRQLITERDTIALHFSLTDRFGDNGLVSVIIARPDQALPNGNLLIDTWLMSCRVLGRNAEAAALSVLLDAAANCGATSLIGEYRPTPKNGLVRHHYAGLGFEEISPPSNATAGATFWRLNIAGGRRPEHHLEIMARL
jgi:FkbH-like protein